MVRTLRHILVVTFVLMSFGPGAYAQSTCATLFTAGPVNPKNGVPLWGQDSHGLTLQLCPDDANCFTVAEKGLFTTFPATAIRKSVNMHPPSLASK